MELSLPLAVASSSVLYILWKMFHPYFVTYTMDNLPGPSADSWWLGNIPTFVNRQGWKIWAQYADRYGSIFLIKTFFNRRMILVHDPKAAHSILLKEQDSFPKRLEPSNAMHALLGPGLLTTVGAQHKRQRKLLNPVFSAAHLRNMTDIFYGITHRLNAAIAKRVPADGTAELDVNGWMARMTLEMLGQAGLGYSFDNFDEDSTDEYGEAIKMYFPVFSRLTILFTYVTQALSKFLSDNSLRRLYRLVPWSPVQKIMAIYDTMDRRSKEIIAEKKATLAKGGDLALDVVEGKDLMSILLKANMTAMEGEQLTDDEILAQTSTFILAGMDTTSNALSRIFSLLAERPDVQEKLRAEILEAQEGDRSDIPYEDLVKLPYLDAVCRETLRIYAPVRFSGPRIAARDMVLPLDLPVRGRDGREISEVVVSRGTTVQVNLQASNTNKALWGEDADEWKPQRWLNPLPSAVEDARIPGVYAHLMTFNAGTHSCIGFKFSQLEMKVVMFVLLSNYSFERADKPVAWNQSPVMYPTMGEESIKPELRLKLKLLRA